MMALRKPFSVLVVIYNIEQQFLLIRRTDDSTFWQSVTGGIDDGESAIDTAYRELKEETGIDAKALGIEVIDHHTTNHYDIRPCWQHRYIANAKENTEYVFSICVPSKIKITLNPSEHTEYKWLSQTEAAQLAWSDTNKQAILNINF